MEASSQKGRPARRPWTAQEQVTAEVAAACGVPLTDIARALDRSYGSVQYRLVAAVADTARARARDWHASHAEESRKASRQYYWANHAEQREKQRVYRVKNQQKIAEGKRRYHQANRAKIIDKVRQWRKENPERRRDQNRLYRERHPDRVAAKTRRHYEANREAIAERARQHRLANPELYAQRNRDWRAANREKAREAARCRSALRRSSRMRALLSLSIDSKRERFALFDNTCAYCGAGNRLTVDHVLPLTAGGLDQFDNIVPACNRCNAGKNASPVESWYRRQPFFTEARWRKIQRHCPAAVTGQLPLAFGPTP
jgi:hypothetical protein